MPGEVLKISNSFEIFSTSPGIIYASSENFIRGHPRSKVIEVKLRSCSVIFVKKKLFQVKRRRRACDVRDIVSWLEIALH